MPAAESSAVARGTTHRQVWGLALPIILANVSVPLLSAVDTAVVGHLPEPYYIGGVAIGGILITYISHLFNCLRMGTTGPTAQARGAENHAEVRAMIARALALAAAIGVALIAFQLPIIGAASWLIDASPEVTHYAREYFLIRVWSMPALLASYAVIGWFYGLREVRIPLLTQLLTNVLNIGLDLLFVFGFGWGVAGVATASVIAQYAGLALALACVWRTLGTLPRGGSASRVLDPERLSRMLSINTDIMLRTLCVVSMHAFFMAKSAQLGDLTLAANQVLHNFLLFTSFGLDGIANASEAILGEAVGRRDREGFQRSRRVVFVSAGTLALTNVAVYAVAGQGIIALLTGIQEVRVAAGAYLIWPVLLPLVSVWAYTYDGLYLAATRTKIMRNAVIVAFIGFLVLLYALLPIYGNAGLWIALSTYLALRGLLLHLCFPVVLKGI